VRGPGTYPRRHYPPAFGRGGAAGTPSPASYVLGVASDREVTLVVAAIAAAATLLGTLVGSLLQAHQAKRQRLWEVDDRAARDAHELALRRHDIGESRFQRLRAERREVYSRLLEAVDEYISALRDLRDSDLPSGIQVTSVHELETSHPISARAVRGMERQKHLESEIVLIADREVRDSVLILSATFREAFRAAVSGSNELSQVYVQRDVVLGAMRRELVGPTGD
jgi:hypothetical protein